MSTCRWDREAGEYLADGEPCKVDDYGDPTKHCTARRTCSAHIGRDELTCPRCIGRTRGTLRRIPTLAVFASVIATTAGVDSAALNIAGPSAHPVQWSWRRINARREAAQAHLSTTWDEAGFEEAVERIEEDDDRHPAVVIRWAAMIAEDYGHDLPERWTVTSAADYLDRNLARIANDPEQDWPLLSADMLRCRKALEAAEALSLRPQRGVPCPECMADMEQRKAELIACDVPEDEWPKVRVPKLVREYGHWCDDGDCERIHHADDTDDVWVCPRDRAHRWAPKAYDDYLLERRGA